MDNFTSISKRLKQFIDFKGISINKFSNKIGVSNSYFNKMFKNNASIGSHIIEKIVRTYSELNAVWLLTGEGDMLKSGTGPPGREKPTEVAVLEARLHEKEKEIGRLNNIIEMLIKAGPKMEHRNLPTDQPKQRTA